MEVLTILMMISSVFVFGFRSYKLSILSYVFQAFCLVSLFFLLANLHGAKELFSWAIIAFFMKVCLVPAIIFYLVKKLNLIHENEPTGGFLVSIVIAFGFSIATAMVIAPIFGEFSLIKNETALVASIFIFMMGIFGFILRNSFIKQILAYCLFENGIHLSLALSAYNSHSLVELGILTDAIFAVIIMSVLAYHYHKTFGHVDISKASNLKG